MNLDTMPPAPAPMGVFRSGPGATQLVEPCSCGDCLECELRAARARRLGIPWEVLVERDRRALKDATLGR